MGMTFVKPSKKTIVEILVVLALIIGILLPKQGMTTGVDSYLTQKVVGGNTSAWRWIAANGTGLSWFYVGRQTVTPDPSTYAFGTILLNGTYYSDGSDNDDATTGRSHFTLTNYGENTIEVTIGGTDWLGANSTWTLSNTATAGADTLGLRVGLSSDSGDTYETIVRKDAAYNTFIASLGASGTQDFGLQLLAPTSMTAFQAMNGNITLTISLP